MPANLDDTPNVLLRNESILTGEHLRDDVRSYMVLVSVAENDVSESSDRNFLSLLDAIILPMVVDSLAELNSGCQGEILIE